MTQEKCCVCLCDDYKDKVIFACKHFVCSKCFKDMVNHSYEMCTIDVRCPMCRYLIEPSFISKKGEELKVHCIYQRPTFTLLNMVDMAEDTLYTDSMLLGILTRKLFIKLFTSVLMFIVFLLITVRVNMGFSLTDIVSNIIKKIFDTIYVDCSLEENEEACDMNNLLEYMLD